MLLRVLIAVTAVAIVIGILFRLLSAFLQSLEQADSLLALQFQLADGSLQGFFGLGLGIVVDGDSVCIMIVDGLQGGAPRAKGFGLVVLRRRHVSVVLVNQTMNQMGGGRHRSRKTRQLQ